ncbi:Uncharacterised protein [Moraxella atlantae]|uniref:Uncharacterized protein n=1 Tax=Faucicola atlantae TaxID=34059 RepID=A0A378QME9_9GAMM|nr:Uncharacterised protein [Moraxella atlantae]
MAIQVVINQRHLQIQLKPARDGMANGHQRL